MISRRQFLTSTAAAVSTAAAASTARAEVFDLTDRPWQHAVTVLEVLEAIPSKVDVNFRTREEADGEGFWVTFRYSTLGMSRTRWIQRVPDDPSFFVDSLWLSLESFLREVNAAAGD